jgi:copper chaperone CopZ
VNTRTAFDIDCHPVFPECEFDCPKCIQEIEATLASMDGVSKVYMGEGPDEGRVCVEHDPDVASVEQLIQVLGTLPSFYEGFFVASPAGS